MKQIGQNQTVVEYVNGMDWYRYDTDILCEKLGSDLHNGLSSQNAAQKRSAQEKNDIFPEDENEKSGNFKTSFSVLSAVLIILLSISAFVLGDKTSIFGIILTVSGYALMLLLLFLSKKITKSNSSYSTPEVRVLRDGKIYRISQENVVQGDIVLLSQGDLIPCDGRILYCENLKVLEKNISGGDGVKDADFYEKRNGLDPKDQKNMVFARSAVSAGTCRILACDTGSHTLAVRRGIRSKASGSFNLKIFDTTAKLSRIYSVSAAAALFVVSIISYFTGGENEIFYSFVLMLSFAASSFCELFCTIAYFAVSVGLIPSQDRRGEYNNGVIIKNVSALQRLRELTCLFIPKTSGICEKNIEAELIYTNGRELEITEDNADKLKRTAYIAISTLGGRQNHTDSKTSQTQEQECLIELMGRLGLSLEEAEKTMIPTDYKRADGERLFDTALVIYKNEFMICVRGPAKQIVKRCAKRISNGAPVPLSEDGKSDLIAKASEYESLAYRVMAIASKKSKYNSLDMIAYAEDELCFEGFIVLTEPFSQTCADTVSKLEKMGVKTVMMCDDRTEQSYHLAKHIGICKDNNLVLSSPEFNTSNIHIMDLKMKSYRLFKGLSYKQKKYVEDIYEQNGEKIGVVGQNLYDISLMNGKHTVGFAANLTMRPNKRKTGVLERKTYVAEGSEALKRAADAVILPADRYGNGGINAVLDSIINAKRIYNNLFNIFMYLTAANAARLLLSVLTVFTGNAFITSPQIIFSGVFADLLSILGFCFSNNRKMARECDLFKAYENKLFLPLSFSALSGLIIGGLCAVSGLISSALAPGEGNFVCFASLLIVQVFGAVWLCKGFYSLMSGLCKVHAVSILLLLEYFALSALFKDFFTKYLTGSAYVKTLFISLLPVVVFIVAYEILKSIIKRKIKK